MAKQDITSNSFARYTGIPEINKSKLYSILRRHASSSQFPLDNHTEGGKNCFSVLGVQRWMLGWELSIHQIEGSYINVKSAESVGKF